MDREGDACDLDDGLILIDFLDHLTLAWQREILADSFNEYRGDLDILKSAGIYTQDPQTIPLAMRNCGLTDAILLDGADPPPGKAAFYLVTGVRAGIESSLGTNSAGVERPNTFPCP